MQPNFSPVRYTDMKRFTLLSALLIVPTAFVACQFTRAGYESAAYTAATTEGDYEVRDYPELAIASTTAPLKDGKRSDDGQFMQLFGYITGKNEKTQKIEMTTPVFMDGEKRTRMSFVLPKTIAADQAPKPSNEKISVTKLPARKMAVLRFSGSSNAETEEAKLALLKTWAAEKKLTITGEPVVAYYDPPFTPPKLRRNEVMLPVK
jgi:effector-binding domain-containing protein